MRAIFPAPALVLILALGMANPVFSQEAAIGKQVESLLDFARNNNPEFASMRHEADAASERITPAGALPDPKFRTEFMDITKMGEQNPTLLPNKVGSTKYLLMQDVPWYGKRDLKREIAEIDAEGAQGLHAEPRCGFRGHRRRPREAPQRRRSRGVRHPHGVAADFGPDHWPAFHHASAAGSPAGRVG